jgi:hypothetical protein
MAGVPDLRASDSDRETVILVSAFRLAYDGWHLLDPTADAVPPEYRRLRL